jgi:serine O-acetyltransferase
LIVIENINEREIEIMKEFMEDEYANSNKRAKRLLYLLRKAKLGWVWKKLFEMYSNNLTCIIPISAQIGRGLRIPHPQGIVITAYSTIGEYCTIYQNVTIGANEHKQNYKNGPKIGNRVYIGAGAVLIGDITIGDDVIIGANATITKSVPSNTLVVGNNNIISGNIERNTHPCLKENIKD